MTAIEWTDVTDNPIVVEEGGWWCRKVDKQCLNCYAERLNSFRGNGLAFNGEPPKLVLKEDLLAGWKKQRKRQRHFVGSMTDVFGEWVPREWQLQLFDAMAAAPAQTFQLLTKRPEVALTAAQSWLALRGGKYLPENIWVGCSVGDQITANRRRQFMAAMPAVITFASYEPALGPIDFSRWEFLNWLICGGESGPEARPSSLAWFRQARDWCQKQVIPFFFKQHGNWLATEQGSVPTLPTGTRIHLFDNPYLSVRIGKQAAGRLLDGRTWDEFPKELQ